MNMRYFHKFNFIPLILPVFFMVFLTTCKKLEVGPSSNTTCNMADSSAKHPKNADYKAIIDKYVAKGFPGIILLIHDSDGLWVGSSGMADIQAGTPMTPCTVSKVASITKTFIGVIIMKLVEEGKINLDSKVGVYLSHDLIGKVKNAEESTVRQLMNHTSGIYDIITGQKFYLDVLNNPPKHRTDEELIRYAYGKTPYFPVGTDCYYSNTNFLLLSMIINKVSEKSETELLHERIFQPLGLTNSYYSYHDDLPATVAQGYFDLYNNGTVANVSNYFVGNGNGYNGIYSNVYDLMTFIEALLVKKTLVSQNSLDQMLTFDWHMEPETYRFTGLAIIKDFIDKNRDTSRFAYGHRGRDLGYSADLLWFPKKNTTMVMFVNYGTDGNSSLRPWFYELRDEVADEIYR
jgi:D-alanyl-D-alanine carboxypeptidase